MSSNGKVNNTRVTQGCQGSDIDLEYARLVAKSTRLSYLINWHAYSPIQKGDLEELVGKAPHYTPSKSSTAGFFPNPPVEAAHPYHLVVM